MSKSSNIRVLFAMVVLGLIILKMYFPCLLIRIEKMPDILSRYCRDGNINILILFGGNICSTCPSGRYLINKNNDKNILIIVPKDYSDIDIINMKGEFKISGNVVRSNNKLYKYYLNIKACASIKKSISDILVEVKKIRSKK
jgi:hypothetical protein